MIRFTLHRPSSPPSNGSANHKRQNLYKVNCEQVSALLVTTRNQFASYPNVLANPVKLMIATRCSRVYLKFFVIDWLLWWALVTGDRPDGFVRQIKIRTKSFCIRHRKKNKFHNMSGGFRTLLSFSIRHSIKLLL